MLHFITGRAGCGKTHYIKEQISRELDSGKDIVLIIPEQSSFEYERDFLRYLGDSRYAKLNVYSFTRLARVISRDMPQTKPAIDSFGKIMLMHRAVSLTATDLNLYAKHKGDVVFVQSLISLAGEFKNRSLLPDSISALSGKLSGGILKQKLYEISLILQNYYMLLNERYSDPADDLERLSEILKQNRFFENKLVFIDSFTGFTGSQLKIIGDILAQSDETYITLLCDNDSSLFADDLSLFAPVKKNARLIYDAAKRANVKTAVPVKLNGQYRIVSDDLKHLEQTIFSPASNQQYDGKSENISVYHAVGAHDEAEFAAQTICSLVRNHNMRYRDIAVIARDMSPYNGIIDVVFKKYNIPLFMDSRQTVDSTPLFTFVLSLLQIAAYGFNSDCIFRLLKTGLAGISQDDISELENYCSIWDIDGDMWTQPFTGHPQGLGLLETKESALELSRLDLLRQRVTEPLARFRQDISDAAADVITSELYNLLCDYGVSDSLKKLAGRYLESGQLQAAQDQDRLWNLLCDILERCSQALNGVKIPVKEYYELIRITVEDSTVGQIPIMMDAVSAGEADRMHPSNLKAVILIGANDGVFPQQAGSSGLLSGYERSVMASLGGEISDPPEMQAMQERLLCYMSMTYPSHKLFISAQKLDLLGETRLPSVMVNECIDMFADSIVQSPLIDSADNLYAPDQAFESMAKLWRQNSAYSASLKKFFSEQDEYRSHFLRVADAAQSDPTKAILVPDSIFNGKSVFLSASKVETFYNCRYHYFCKYVLGANPRPTSKLDSRHFGSMLHYTLEMLLKNNGKAAFIALSDDQRGAQVDAILKQYADLYLGSFDNKPARFKVLFRRWSNNCKLIAAQLARELSQSEFEPVDFELKIGADIQPLTIRLSDDKTIYITGSIDRVDTFKKGDKTYLRIIDYKSGKKQFKLCELLDGLNMQMLIYLMAIMQNGSSRYGEIQPSGILYMPANAASVYREPDIAMALKRLAANLKMNGMLLDDEQSLLAMEKEGGGKYIPLKLNDDGTIKITARSQASAPSYSRGQYQSISDYVVQKLRDMANALNRGDISPNPCEEGGRSFCDFCDYSGICNRERQSPHKAASYDHQTAIELISGKQSMSNESEATRHEQ